MIRIKKSPTADTRTCDVSKVSRQQLLDSSRQHIMDVANAMAFFSSMLLKAAAEHDYDKLTNIDQFYEDFQHKFAFGSTSWWDNHRKIHRHHLAQPDGVPEDVNLIDILEYISDCVMAGMARSGEVYALEASNEMLQKAFGNTVQLLKGQVTVSGE
jgi:RNAse (barnase) inhibitor barstar